MTTTRGFLFFLFVLISSTVKAYDFGDGSINIPDGFEGPITQSVGQGASLIGFTFPHGSAGGALLQITIWNPGQKFPEMSINELKAGSEKYLLQFLGGIEKKRNNFKQSQVEFVQISGNPAAKVTWTGLVQGEEAHGVMYCLVFNSTIYSFHTQDLSSYGGRYTKLAVNAFESIELKK